MNTKIRQAFFVLLTFVGGFGLGLAAVEPYQVTINGQPSSLQVQQEKETLLVPLTIPVTEQSAVWTVSFQRNDQAHTVNITMSTPKKEPLRGYPDCYYCAGNGLCANDYPVGSGRNYSGITENTCNGTGRCYHCSGTGKLGL